MYKHACERCGKIRVAQASHGLGRICRECYSPDPEGAKAIRETKKVFAKMRREFNLRRNVYVND